MPQCIPTPCILKIALDTPLNALFDYRWNPPAGAEQADAAMPLPQVGQLALVPFGRREVMGLIVGVSDSTDVPAARVALGVCRAELVSWPAGARAAS